MKTVIAFVIYQLSYHNLQKPYSKKKASLETLHTVSSKISTDDFVKLK